MRSDSPAERSRRLAIFTTWPFVLALVMLLVNDRLLKHAYPGFVTGKLSDFAGIAVVALPLFAAFPRHARTIYLALAAAFLWWKSPASSSFIAFMNEMQPLNIGRTVDYADLIALAVLPVCAWFAAAESRRAEKPARLQRWLLPPVLAAALLGVMGTSTPMLRQDFAIRSVETSAPFPHDEVVEVLEAVAKKRGLRKAESNPPHWEGAFAGKGLFFTYSFPSPKEVAIGIQADPGMFGKGEARHAENLRKAIKQSLDLRFKGLEYSSLPADH
jgi:hypothetical protein